MTDLIAALTLFLKYGDPTDPTHCERDAMYVCIDPAIVSPDDKAALAALGFFPDTEHADVFLSYRFGSA